MKDEKIIMYDSPEAAREMTVTGWVSSDNRFFGKDEHLARYAGCTHNKCECGNIIRKGWMKCETCRNEISSEKFFALPLVEWNGIDPVYYDDGDKYFFDGNDLSDYMQENEMEEIDLIICVPQPLSKIRQDYWEDDLAEDGELPDELVKAITELNKLIESLPAQCYYPGKTRTYVKLNEL